KRSLRLASTWISISDRVPIRGDGPAVTGTGQYDRVAAQFQNRNAGNSDLAVRHGDRVAVSVLSDQRAHIAVLRCGIEKLYVVAVHATDLADANVLRRWQI